MIAKKLSDVKLENNLECNDQTSQKIRDKKFVKKPRIESQQIQCKFCSA